MVEPSEEGELSRGVETGVIFASESLNEETWPSIGVESLRSGGTASELMLTNDEVFLKNSD